MQTALRTFIFSPLMSERQIKGVLFDLGDTLVDYRHVNISRMFKAGARLAYKYLVELDKPVPSFRRYHFTKMIAVRWNYLKSLLTGREFNSLSTLAQLNTKMDIHLTAEETLELARLWYRPLGRSAVLDPDAQEVLGQLKDAGLTLGLISNTFVPGEVLDDHLQREGLLEYLPIRVYSCDVHHRKPDPRIFQLALAKTHLAPKETLFVGDSLKADVEGANRAGMISVLKDPLDSHSGGRIVPQYRIRRLVELPEIVARHGGAQGG